VLLPPLLLLLELEWPPLLLDVLPPLELELLEVLLPPLLLLELEWPPLLLDVLPPLELLEVVPPLLLDVVPPLELLEVVPPPLELDELEPELLPVPRTPSLEFSETCVALPQAIKREAENPSVSRRQPVLIMLIFMLLITN
jgi:hypothetical protein